MTFLAILGPTAQKKIKFMLKLWLYRNEGYLVHQRAKKILFRLLKIALP